MWNNRNLFVQDLALKTLKKTFGMFQAANISIFFFITIKYNSFQMKRIEARHERG